MNKPLSVIKGQGAGLAAGLSIATVLVVAAAGALTSGGAAAEGQGPTVHRPGAVHSTDVSFTRQQPAVTTGHHVAPVQHTTAAPGTTHAAVSGGDTPVDTATGHFTFVAWTADGHLQPGLRIGATVSGSCWTGSIASSLSTAWRCMSGNYIFDPCVAPPHEANPKELVCIDSPSRPVTIFKLTAKLPLGDANHGWTSPAWALQLANHTECIISTGANLVIHGVPMIYSCEPAGTGGIAGGIDTRSATWTAEYAPLSSLNTLHTVDVLGTWLIANP